MQAKKSLINYSIESAWKIVQTGRPYNGKYIHELLIIAMGSNIISCAPFMYLIKRCIQRVGSRGLSSKIVISPLQCGLYMGQCSLC